MYDHHIRQLPYSSVWGAAIYIQAHKIDLKELATSLLAMNLEDSDDLYTSQHGLEELIFECDLIVKRLLVTVAPPATTAHAAL